MNKRGFTLVELLAVIAILAILVIIAMPNVLKMFNESKKDSFETEVKAILTTTEKQWLSDSMGSTGSDVTVYCRVNGVDCDNALKLDGNKDIDYYVTVDSHGNITQFGAVTDEHQFSNVEGLKPADEINSETVSDLKEEEKIKITENGIVKNDEVVSKINYAMIEGANQTYDGGGVLRFASKAKYSAFDKVLVDGNVVDKANYNTYEGSTVVVFKDSYAKSLSVGGHEIEIVSKSGSAKCQFMVAAFDNSTYVASVNGKNYTDFIDAMNYANSLISNIVNVKLYRNVTLDKQLVISKNINLTGTSTITRADSFKGNLFKVSAGVTFKIEGIKFDGGNNFKINQEEFNNRFGSMNYEPITTIASIVSSESSTAPDPTSPMFDVSGTLDLKDVIIQNSYTSRSGVPVIKVNSNSTLNMTGTTIKHITSPGSSTVVSVASGAKWNINNGTLITGVYGGSNGAISRNDSGLITMNGGTVKDNYAINGNGSFIMCYLGSFTMNGGLITGNKGLRGSANGRNSVIYLHKNSTMVMNGGEISNNTGTGYGGIDAQPTSISLVINGGSVINNISANGNPLKDIQATNVTINGGKFTQNVASMLGEGKTIKSSVVDGVTYYTVK